LPNGCLLAATDEWKPVTSDAEAAAALKWAAVERSHDAQAGKNPKKPDAETELREGAKTELQQNRHPDAKTELLA
jgi:hypothetical protein